MITVRTRSAGEARPLALSGWPTAIVSAVDSADLAVERPAHLDADDHLILEFDDVTSADMGVPIHPDQLRQLVDFARRLPSDERVLVHCRGGIGRSPACAVAILCAVGVDIVDALDVVILDRPQAQPNPLVILELDDVLGAGGNLWHAYHQWAFEQPWWTSRLRPDRGRSMRSTRDALTTQTHRTRPKRRR
jgi:predicted protein tyrosine phosphatase